MRTATGGGLTPISTAIVEGSGGRRTTVFRKFRTDDGHTWCHVSGSAIDTVGIPEGYRPNKDTYLAVIGNYVRDATTFLIMDTVSIRANGSEISKSDRIPYEVVFFGDNVWQVS